MFDQQGIGTILGVAEPVVQNARDGEHGVESEYIQKLYEGRPNIVDAIKNGEIQLIVNTPVGKMAATDDSYIRKEAIRQRIPCLHTVAAANAAAEGIAAHREGRGGVKSLQEYHQDIRSGAG